MADAARPVIWARLLPMAIGYEIEKAAFSIGVMRNPPPTPKRPPRNPTKSPRAMRAAAET